MLPGETSLEGEQSLTGKTASSMALHLGRETVVNECYGAYGWRLTMSEMKWLADWLFVRGTNRLMPHAFYYSVEGPRLRERPPDLAWASLRWDHYGQFSAYTNRMSWLMHGGEPVADVGILAIGGKAPWRAAKVLLESQIDFFYVEESMLDTAHIANGRLQVGAAEYGVVILDGASNLRPETHRRIKGLIDGRVKVVAFDSSLSSHPILADARPPNERWAIPERVVDSDALLEAIRPVVPTDVETSEPMPDLRYAHRIKDGVHFYLFTNEGDERIRTQARLRQTISPEVWDAETGEVQMPLELSLGDESVRVGLDLPPRNSTILAFTGREWPGVRSRPPNVDIPLPWTGWRVTAGERELEGWRLGSWTRVEGLESYSGAVWYEREFEMPAETEGRWFLDLGEVRDIAEAELNGHNLGVRLWPPYRFDVHDALQQGPNRLRVRVTNTRANQLTDEKLPSGLFGEVRITR